MIHFIKGTVAMKLEDSIVLENNGIGYRIKVPSGSAPYLAGEEEPIILYTVMIVREDDVSLYGFSDEDSLAMFNQLITVSSVGAKVGIAILSALTVGEIKKAVVFNDPDMLTRAQGVGKKTAQRIVLELKDKLDAIGGYSSNDESLITASGKRANGEGSSLMALNEALEALVALGYSKSEASEALAGISLEEATAEAYIKQALQRLSVL